MKKIAVISGSSRENSKTLVVSKWISDQMEYELVDLLDFNLSHYNEPSSPRSAKEYKYDETKKWSNKVKEFDGFIFVIPEYNGFFPGIVKDAIDYLYYEWEGKDFALVGLGGKGGKWACDHLRTLLERFNMTFKGYVGVLNPWDNVSYDGTVDEKSLTSPIESILTF